MKTLICLCVALLLAACGDGPECEAGFGTHKALPKDCALVAQPETPVAALK
jgi:hypothetical protein